MLNGLEAVHGDQPGSFTITGSTNGVLAIQNRGLVLDQELVPDEGFLVALHEAGLGHGLGVEGSLKFQVDLTR